ncbi:AMP-binding protein [Bradyrhizobium sp. USDA 4501]
MLRRLPADVKVLRKFRRIRHARRLDAAGPAHPQSGEGRVADLYPNKTVTTRYCDRVHVISHAELLGRAGQLANFLAEIGVERGMRVATLAWNSRRHLELYLAVPCMGAVLHTINARLHALDIARLLAHAEDRVLFVDRSIWRTVGTEIELRNTFEAH